MNPNITSIDFVLNQPPPVQPPTHPIATCSIEKTEPVGGRISESKPIAEIKEAAKNEQPKQPTVQDYVQIHTQVPVIPADVAAAGVQVAPAVVSANEPVLELPLPDDQIPVALKKPVSSGMRWIAEICLYMLRKAHLKIKTIHGKVTRVAIK